MIYKFDNGIIHIWNTGNNSRLEIPFIEDIKIFRVSINPIADKIAVMDEPSSNASKLFIIDLKSYKNISELKDILCSDFQWYDNDTIIYSDGKLIHSFYLPDNKTKELIKFSRIRTAPIGITISANLSKILFHKWKGDNRKLCIYNMHDSTFVEFKPSVYDYAWQDNNHILFNLGGGLKQLDIQSGQSVAFIKNVQDFLKKSKAKDEQAEDLMNVAMLGEPIINEISNPKIYNGRLYCELFLVKDTEKRNGIISLKLDFFDLTFHIYKTVGLIKNYYVLNNPNIIGIYLEPNTLIGESFEPGIQYFENNKRLYLNGYSPCWTPSMPT